MNSIKLNTALILFLALPHVAIAQTYFVDTFDDKSVTDGTPVTWSNDDGMMDAASGDLVLTTGNDDTMSAFIGSSYTDSIITTKFMLLSDFEQFGQMSRVQSDGNGYFSELTPSGRISLFRGGTNLARFETGIEPLSEDVENVWMQMRTSGNSITLRAWADGTARPREPQLSITDSTYTSGILGVWFDPGNASNLATASVAIRSFEVSNVPEPCGATMMLVGSLIMLRRLRIRCRT